ncbi:CHC2 zinc finger domain-containing protein [Vibrio parahaemolyticus]|uniref:CHC2 zinc finger domain-containing protein n=1 Tax=Vibrio parahaemolyticus TaxID=670 RepID=UPI0015D40368|nr:CHC2 zinc finger domain-containing protein [Vibrio parahaemolyticus]NYU23816.1 hypothetical protein [Vibrio parahaemolyticus]
MSFSNQDIEAIKSRVVLSEFLAREFNLGSYKKQGTSLKCPCPFHNGVKDNFEVNDDHQHWHCWSDDCGGGDVFEALQKGHGMSFGKAVRYVADQIGYKLSYRDDVKSFSASKDMTVFCTNMYKHFKLASFDHERDIVNYNLALNNNAINGFMRCDPLKKESWFECIKSKPELKRATENLDFYNQKLGMLNETFSLQPMVKIRRLDLNFMNDDLSVHTIPATELATMEVNGFKVFDSTGEFIGFFPQAFEPEHSVSIPLLSVVERMQLDNRVLTVVDSLNKYNEHISNDNLNVVLVDSTLSYNQMNSIMMLSPQDEMYFECSKEYFENSVNRKSLMEMMSRVSNKPYEATLSFDNGETKFKLWQYCYQNLKNIDSQEELYSLKEILKNLIVYDGYTNENLEVFADSLLQLEVSGLTTVNDFLKNYFNLGSVSKEDMENFQELVLNYGYERSEKVKSALSYFDLRAEVALVLDVQHKANELRSKIESTPSMS